MAITTIAAHLLQQQTSFSSFSSKTIVLYFTLSVFCVFLSGFCDAFDGMVARSKKNRTEDEKAYGIQLDSLCDIVSFGVCPAFICYEMGVNGIFGILILMAYCLCALIRLAFFNVLEEKRQKEEGGANKYYRGLPVTSIAMIFPMIYLFKSFMPANVFVGVLHIMLALVAFLFILDFKMKKPEPINVKIVMIIPSRYIHQEFAIDKSIISPYANVIFIIH